MDLLNRTRLLASALALSACVPELDSDEATVRTPRVLAIQSEPAEATPGAQPVRYRALVADERGVREDADVRWFYCLAQKPLAELGPVSRECLRSDSGRLAPLGSGTTLEATLPSEACSLFGPNPPPPKDDAPPGRPVDADESGGYKLPVMVGVASGEASEVVLYEQRIRCGLAGVSPALSLEYALRYHDNQNPSVRELRIVRADGARAVLASGQPLDVAAGERVALEIDWPACPASDVCGDGVCGPDESRQTCLADCGEGGGCGGQERYVDLDREALVLTTRREAMRVAWYATAGSYDQERTGVADDVTAPGSTNGWRAPASAGTATLWAVLRDSRGGVGFVTLPVRVR